MKRLIQKLKDWHLGWNEPSPWEKEALGLMEVLAQESLHVQRSHPNDKDCWCTACCGYRATEWINDYWARRLKRSSVKATMQAGTLIVSDKP